MPGERLDEQLARLEQERAQADRLYNEALTALDRSLSAARAMPDPPPPYDETKLAAVNEAWNILPAGAPAIDGSVKGRLRGFIWRLVGPALEAQRQFNAALVDHLNRNVGVHREAQKSIRSAIEILRGQAESLARFQTLLVQYLQTVTLYVDTKDRAVGSQAQIINAGVHAMADDWLKRWESLAARQQRFLDSQQPLARNYAEVQSKVSLALQSATLLKREVERLQTRDHAPGLRDTDDPRVSVVPDLDSFKYVGFEDRFRGSPEDIRERLADYVPIFAGGENVLDVGCGRGELLDLFRQSGISARGIDLNPSMVDVCRARGLAAEQADALAYLQALPDESLGGLVAVQVVEHLEPGYLVKVLEMAFHKLRPGAPLVLETLNPACWVAFFESYIRDITHRCPLHPDTLHYLVEASGFAQVKVDYRAPVSYADKLQHVSLPATLPGSEHDATLVDLAEAVNAHADKLNARLFTFLDYAVVARR